MSYIYFPEDASGKAYIGCHKTEEGEFILSCTNYPASFLMTLPASVAVSLATQILEQASAKLANG